MEDVENSLKKRLERIVESSIKSIQNRKDKDNPNKILFPNKIIVCNSNNENREYVERCLSNNFFIKKNKIPIQNLEFYNALQNLNGGYVIYIDDCLANPQTSF